MNNLCQLGYVLVSAVCQQDNWKKRLENVREKYSLTRLIKVPKSSRDMKRLRSGRDIHDTCVRENGTSIFFGPSTSRYSVVCNENICNGCYCHLISYGRFHFIATACNMREINCSAPPPLYC